MTLFLNGGFRAGELVDSIDAQVQLPSHLGFSRHGHVDIAIWSNRSGRPFKEWQLRRSEIPTGNGPEAEPQPTLYLRTDRTTPEGHIVFDFLEA